MKKKIFQFTIFTLQFALCTFSFAQDDLLKELESDATPKDEKVTATFKANRVVNAHSCETVKKKTLDFRITHRFGNMVPQKDTAGNITSGGVHEYYGFDNARDIRFSFDYGITDRLQVGIGRSKQNENFDGSVKYKFLEQSSKIPLTMVWFSDAAFSIVKESQFYSGADSIWVANNKNIMHRLSYVHQLIIARKFGSRFSFEILPTVNYRNLVKNDINTYNNAADENLLYSVGVAGRIKVTQRFSLVGDYFYVISNYRVKNPIVPYYSPLGIGFELETGGHVFTVNFTNASAIIENANLAGTSESWKDAAFKLGFSISRVFSF